MRLESEGNDAGLVDLVESGELFGQLGSGDRGSRRVEDIDDKLPAGKEGVFGKFPGTDRNRGRVVLGGKGGKRVSIIVARTTASRHGGIHPARLTRFSPTIRRASLLYELYGTILTAMVSSCDVLFLCGLQAATYCTVCRWSKRGNWLWNQSPFGDSRFEDPEHAQLPLHLHG